MHDCLCAKIESIFRYEWRRVSDTACAVCWPMYHWHFSPWCLRNLPFLHFFWHSLSLPHEFTFLHPIMSMSLLCQERLCATFSIPAHLLFHCKRPSFYKRLDVLPPPRCLDGDKIRYKMQSQYHQCAVTIEWYPLQYMSVLRRIFHFISSSMCL